MNAIQSHDDVMMMSCLISVREVFFEILEVYSYHSSMLFLF